MFICTKCGICCRNLDANPLYSALDRGDGVCVNLDERQNLCSIYQTRPQICRADEMFDLYFKASMTFADYIRMNAQVCHAKQVEAGISEVRRIKFEFLQSRN